MAGKSCKVSIIGAGAVGSTLAMRIVENNLADVVLVDVLENLASGKALDILDAAPIMGHERHIKGAGRHDDMRDSDIVVLAAGFPRKPGMTREELIASNAQIVEEASGSIKLHAPSSIVIIVTNPLDAMTYLAYKTTGFERRRIFGMAGVLDGGRLKQAIADELRVPRSSVETFVLGSHGDTMVPLLSHTSVAGQPIEKRLSKERIDALVKRTRDRGAQIVSLLGTGSAYCSPSAAAFKMIEAIVKDSKEVMTASAYLEGEYGLKDICIGVPCRIGRNGVEEIVALDLTKEEREAFLASAQAIKDAIEDLKV